MTEHRQAKQPAVTCQRVAGQPVVIIDNAHPHPDELVRRAQSRQFARDPGNYYPGLRCPADSDYRHFLQTLIDRHALGYFSDKPTHCDVQASLYSLACTPESELRPIQCVPHIDSPEPTQLAAVHYLCGEPFGGTSFYRHRDSGLSSINRDAMADYFSRVKRQMMAAGKSALHYTNGSNQWFERIGQVPAVYNRLIVYRGNSLHAGDLDTTQLSGSAAGGRLTLNSFLHYQHC